ncbi:carcinoembryonic antigen-related cell adhesion molecule 5-like isoform X2 [Dreissena polymorpha]|uniref:carcinoembryonic antigen-related cell adhesion molecule 5-like isoform X2 n=1 Tax=Dreissena polymorpha TaxID=45954 RepID=UPI002264D68B|nr:carcinoembryonic antigen-related cell adhesion molecule 5-like isoform X2 [Dreissena polymorpha]
MMAILLFFLYLYGPLLCVAQQVILSPSPTASVVEGQNLTLLCYYDGAENSTNIAWNENGIFMGSVRLTPLYPCVGYSALANTSMFSVECRSNNVFAVTIVSVHRSRNNASWQCQMLVDGIYIPSNNISVKVQVGITGVTMTSPSKVNIISHTQATLQCQTSGGLPSASVAWYLGTETDFIDVSSDSLSRSSTVDGLLIVTSTLALSPSRNNINLKAFCSARNVGPTFNSSTTVIDVLYGPDKPQCLYRGSSVTGRIMITQGSTLSVSCTSNSNPPPSGFQWTLPIIGTQTVSQLDVTNIKASHSGLYLISVWNSMRPTVGVSVKETNSTTFTMDVQYSPTPPAFYITSTAVNGTVKIIEGNSLTIQCVSQSNPAASYTWTHGGIILSNGQNLLLSNPRSPSDAGVYECRAENILTPTGGPTQSPQSSTSRLTLDILFPPRSTSFKYGSLSGQTIRGNNISIVRGTNQTVACVADSNPESSYQWELQGTSQLLLVNNIKTNTTRTCNVTTTMVETFGQTKTTTNLTTLRIDVLFKKYAYIYLYLYAV